MLSFLIPAIILSYYGVAGGWITKYMVTYISGAGHTLAGDGYLTDFFSKVTFSGFIETMLDAMCQTFYSLKL